MKKEQAAKIMKLFPKAQQIKGIIYTIDWPEEIGGDSGEYCWGTCDTVNKVIAMSQKMHFFERHVPGVKWATTKCWHTFFHECGHALHEETGLHQTSIPPDYFELFTENHASMVVNILKL